MQNIVSVTVQVQQGSAFAKPYAEALNFTDVNTNSKIKAVAVRLESQRTCAIVFTTKIPNWRRMKRLRTGHRLAIWYIGNIDAVCREDAKRQILERINETDYTAPKVRPIQTTLTETVKGN